MKKITLFLLSFVMLGSVSAQGISKFEARQFILRTNDLVLKAKNEVQIHKVFTGDLKQAIIYEDEAIRLFKNEKYGAAFYHSYIARFYANKSINANTGGTKKFIETLSIVEKRIVIDDTSAGFWRPGKSGKEFINKDFVDIAVNNARIPPDHVGRFSGGDEELSGIELVFDFE